MAVEGTPPKDWGQAQFSKLTIRLQSQMPSKDFAVGVVIHELFHAGLYSFGVTYPKKEEEGALFTETFWTTLYRDNPWLLDWIKKGLK